MSAVKATYNIGLCSSKALLFHGVIPHLFHSNIQSWQMHSLLTLDPYVFLTSDFEVIVLKVELLAGSHRNNCVHLASLQNTLALIP